MASIKVLDVTLRDGGCVNNFNFGHDYMHKILSAQEQSGLDIIEVGYVDEKNGTSEERTQWDSLQSIKKNLLKKKKKNISYVAMIDYGKFDLRKLPLRDGSFIDGIRLAFHKKNLTDIIDAGKIILEKGFDLYLQPMITIRYSDSELLNLVGIVNKEFSNASALYIVDSFGEMRSNDLTRVFNLIDHNLHPSIQIGFHSHNNLQLSYSNACALLQQSSNRNIILDGAIMGMGKGAGNLNTELLLEHLNIFFNKNYKISPLLDVIDNVINQIHSEFYWGYAPEYYLSAINHCSPSYASFFFNKHLLPIKQIGELLHLIDDEKKISFDREYAECIWSTYNKSKNINDSTTVKKLEEVLYNKKVVLIAPGRNSSLYKTKIDAVLSRKGFVSIGLNLTEDMDVDYLLITRKELLQSAKAFQKNVITISNITTQRKKNTYILNYKKWIDCTKESIQDSSTVIAFNLLTFCKVKEVYLAGFDGFSADINANYSDPSLRHPISSQQAKDLNAFYKKYINSKKEFKITFLTPSKYE